MWAKGASGRGTSGGATGWADSLGNILITGGFTDSLNFDGIPLWRGSSGAIFIAKYNSSGNIKWATMDGFGQQDGGNSVCCDAAGNVFITGVTVNAGVGHVFIAKYDINGHRLWEMSTGSSPSSVGYSVCCDFNGNIYLTGGYAGGPITFGSISVTGSGPDDAFLFKFDNNGNVLWGKSIGGSGDETGSSVCTDHNGNVFITGNTTSPSISFGSITLTNAGPSNLFLAKYDASGNAIWAKGGSGTTSASGQSLSSDESGNVFLAGNYYNSSLILGSYTLPFSTPERMFIAKFNQSGNILWANSGGGPGGDATV